MTIKQKANSIKQPRGKALLDIKKCFNHGTFTDDKELTPVDSLSVSFMSTLVNNCIRFDNRTDNAWYYIFAESMTGFNKYKQFMNKHINECVHLYDRIPSVQLSAEIDSLNKSLKRHCHDVNDIILPALSKMTTLDNNTIRLIAYLSQFDAMSDSRKIGDCVLSLNRKSIDNSTFENIKIMAERTKNFFEWGNIKFNEAIPYLNAFGYTEEVTSGRPDMVADGAIINVSLSKTPPTNKNTAELMLEYVMATKTGCAMFKNIERLIIWNPRLNQAWTCNVASTIDSTMYKHVKDDILQYNKTWGGLPSNPTNNSEEDPDLPGYICNQWEFK